MTKQQVKRVKEYLGRVAKSTAKHRTEEDKFRASYYLTVVNENTLKDYVIDIIALFTTASKEYIWEVIVCGKKRYDYVEIRTKDNSKTMNRVSVATIKIDNKSKAEAVEIAKAYMVEKNIQLNDVRFNCF